jgi:formate-dependent nitrite reductase membrane component NrfD
MLGAAGVEALMLVIALRLIDWRDHTQVLIFVMSILGYTIVVLGLVALGAHVSRASARIVAVLESTLQR